MLNTEVGRNATRLCHSGAARVIFL